MTRPPTRPPAATDQNPLRGRAGDQRRRDDVATRQMILLAALEVFSVKGFEGASIASIAIGAKSRRISAPLIHYYFKNKDTLWRAAVEFGLGDVLNQLREIIGDLDGFGHVPRLKFFIKRYIALMAERPQVFQIIVKESEAVGPRLTWLFENHLGRLYTMITEIIADAQADGDIVNVAPPYHLAQIMIGAAYHFIGSRNRMREAYAIDVLSRDVRELHAKAVVDVLFNGLLSKAYAEKNQAPSRLAAPPRKSA